MVGMAVGNDGALHWADRIDEEAARLAPEPLGGYAQPGFRMRRHMFSVRPLPLRRGLDFNAAAWPAAEVWPPGCTASSGLIFAEPFGVSCVGRDRPRNGT